MSLRPAYIGCCAVTSCYAREAAQPRSRIHYPLFDLLQLGSDPHRETDERKDPEEVLEEAKMWS